MEQAAAQSQNMTPEQQASLQEGYRQLTVLASSMEGATQEGAAGEPAGTVGTSTEGAPVTEGETPVAHPGTPGA
jgi:hypothetical protein